MLAAAGLLLGLIATVRISPLGSVLTGLAYAVSYGGLLVSPVPLLNLLGHRLSVATYQIDLATPVPTGTTLLLGSLLLVGVASVQRWRRWPQPAADASTAVDPDAIIPPGSESDRPLDTTRPGAATEPEPVMVGGSQWVDSLRGDSKTESWQSDATTRWPSPPCGR